MVLAQAGDQLPPPSLLPLKTPALSAWERVAYDLPGPARNSVPSEKDFPVKANPRSEGRRMPASKNADSPATFERVPLQVSVVRVDNDLREIIRWSDGKQSEKWILSAIVLEQAPEDGSIEVIDPRFFPTEAAKLTSTPFAELRWLRPSFFRGVRKIMDRDAFFYQADDVPFDPNSAEEPLSSSLVAWIDAETHLPLASADRDSLWLYKKRTDPVGPLTLPAAFQAALERNEKRYFHLIGRYKPVAP